MENLNRYIPIKGKDMNRFKSIKARVRTMQELDVAILMLQKNGYHLNKSETLDLAVRRLIEAIKKMK
ncbi:hypothetical protein [Rufibacter quisquiliarum]|uniref:Uncharacterized protein n=1 Tax=Rufibacter quisquiliarum TaxID=1549639 RepID=A0A839GH21_9BACT|nr:hypothetical protein [Rufibacter quisquiliarum]MBA9078192.1 hypothetical protein [Rufibacter quisquiliarum]